MRMALPFFTIGHSNRGLEEFMDLLREPRIERVIDVRKFPASRANPQFNKEALSAALAACQLSYEHIAELGGRRGKWLALPAEVNGFWENRSFHNYADYALSEEFHAGFVRLIERGREQRCAIMCSEAVWWRCHRRLIADRLIAHGETVFHVMGQGCIEPARMTSGGVIEPDGTVVYPANPGAEGFVQ